MKLIFRFWIAIDCTLTHLVYAHTRNISLSGRPAARSLWNSWSAAELEGATSSSAEAGSVRSTWQRSGYSRALGVVGIQVEGRC